MKRFYLVISTMISCLLFTGQASASQDEQDIVYGVIDQVQQAKNGIIISDAYYTMAHNMKIHTSNGNKANRRSLKKGQKVNYTQRFYQNRGLIVDNIWLLPDSANPPEDF